MHSCLTSDSFSQCSQTAVKGSDSPQQQHKPHEPSPRTAALRVMGPATLCVFGAACPASLFMVCASYTAVPGVRGTSYRCV